MANVKMPSVIINDKMTPTPSTVERSSSVGCLFGFAEAGPINTPVKITSWTEYINTFARGLASPFNTNYELAYAVYGFFMNGGKELYVVRVLTGTPKKAIVTDSVTKLQVEAVSEGVWGNSLKLTINKSPAYSSDFKAYDFTLTLGTSEVAKVSNVLAENLEQKLAEDTTMSAYVTITPTGTVVLPTDGNPATLTLSTGAGTDEFSGNEYYCLETLSDLTMVGSVDDKDGISTLIECADKYGLYPILFDEHEDVEYASLTSVLGLNIKGSMVTNPLYMLDPLTSKNKEINPVGHVMGIYARTINERGIQKAPAGLEATIRGVVDVKHQYSTEQIGTLNEVGLIPLINKANVGPVIWGARMCYHKDNTFKYVTDGIINVTIKKYLYQNTEFAVFEPNTETLWASLRTICESYLESLRQKGVLKGSPEEAYYVIIDSTNNTEESINNGILNIDIGYAPVKPAEFVVIKLAHSMASNS